MTVKVATVTRIKTMDYLSVGDIAKRLGVRPTQITDLFYKGRIRDDECPIVGGVRLIPPKYIDVIAMKLRRQGIRVRERETQAH